MKYSPNPLQLIRTFEGEIDFTENARTILGDCAAHIVLSYVTICIPPWDQNAATTMGSSRADYGSDVNPGDKLDSGIGRVI